MKRLAATVALLASMMLGTACVPRPPAAPPLSDGGRVTCQSLDCTHPGKTP